MKSVVSVEGSNICQRTAINTAIDYVPTVSETTHKLNI